MFLIAVEEIFPGCAGGETAHAIPIPLIEEMAKSMTQLFQLGRRHGRLYRMAKIPEGKIRQIAVAMAGAVRRHRLDDGGKILPGFHGSLEGFAPEMPLQSAGLFLLREDHHMGLVTVLCVQGAGGIIVGFRHQRNADMLVFRIGAGRDRHPVGCPAPRRTVLVPVAHILRKIAPAIAIIADGRNQGKGGLSVKLQFHAHMVCRLVCMTVP